MCRNGQTAHKNACLGQKSRERKKAQSEMGVVWDQQKHVSILQTAAKLSGATPHPLPFARIQAKSESCTSKRAFKELQRML